MWALWAQTWLAPVLEVLPYRHQLQPLVPPWGSKIFLRCLSLPHSPSRNVLILLEELQLKRPVLNGGSWLTNFTQSWLSRKWGSKLAVGHGVVGQMDEVEDWKLSSWGCFWKDRSTGSCSGSGSQRHQMTWKGRHLLFYHLYRSLPGLFFLKCFKIKCTQKQIRNNPGRWYGCGPTQICLQVSSRAGGADPVRLRRCGKHCHLPDFLRMSAGPALQTQLQYLLVLEC